MADEEGVDAPDPAFGGPEDRGDFWEETNQSRGLGRWEVIVGIGFFVVALIALFALVGGDDDAADAPATTTTRALASAPPATGGTNATTGATTGATTEGPATTGLPAGEVITRPPAALPPAPLQALPVVVDDFEGDDTDGLGETNGGQPWVEIVGGRWGVRGGAARVIEPNTVGYRNQVIVEDAYINQGTIAAEIIGIEQGVGVLFRYRDINNHLILAPVPELDRWEVQRMVGGERTLVSTITDVPVEGDVLATLQLRGFWIDVYLDGAPVHSVRETSNPLAGGVGMQATGPASTESGFGGFIAGVFPEEDGSAPTTEAP
jgi:hypothetical protein